MDNIIQFPKNRDVAPTMIIPNIINYLKNDKFSYENLEVWVSEFVVAYNEMMHNKSLEFLDKGLNI